jgi:hypothetical protein
VFSFYNYGQTKLAQVALAVAASFLLPEESTQ